MNLTTQIMFGLTCVGSKAGQLAVSPSAETITDRLEINTLFQWLSGVGVNQANQAYTSAGTINAAAMLTTNLGAAMTDAFGDSFTFARVKAVYIENNGTTTLTVAGGITGSVTLRPGEVLLKAVADVTAWATPNPTNLVITNTSGVTAGAYKLALVGATT